jgi:uncharacterized Tic20 family protein
MILSVVLIGFLLFPLIALAGLYVLFLTIYAGIKGSEGASFKYPFIFRLVK